MRRGGTCVTDAYEPRQVREEAAVSKAVCVVSQSTSVLRAMGAFSP